MARQDIAGLLTGMPSSRPDPMAMGGNAEQQRLAFGAQRAQGMQRAARGLMGQSRGTPAEQLQMAMAQLDLSNPADLRKLASIQQATGDLAGAAQTASRIQAMATAKIQEDRAERGLQIREEQLALQQAATERQLNLEETKLAQQGVNRELLYERAINRGMPELANLIRTGGISLEKATTMVFPSSSAAVKAPTKDEKSAFDAILESKGFKDIIKGLEERQWLISSGLSDENKDAIYLKAKEYRVREGLRTEEALKKAIGDLKKLNLSTAGNGTDNTAGTTPKAVDSLLDDLSEASTPASSNSTQRRKRREKTEQNILQDDSRFSTL